MANTVRQLVLPAPIFVFVLVLAALDSLPATSGSPTTAAASELDCLAVPVISGLSTSSLLLSLLTPPPQEISKVLSDRGHLVT